MKVVGRGVIPRLMGGGTAAGEGYLATYSVAMSFITAITRITMTMMIV